MVSSGSHQINQDNKANDIKMTSIPSVKREQLKDRPLPNLNSLGVVPAPSAVIYHRLFGQSQGDIRGCALAVAS